MNTMEFRVSKGELFEQLKDSEIARKERSSFVDYVFDTEIQKLKLEVADISSDTAEAIKTRLVSFHVQFNRKWKLHQRSAARFKKHDAGFLKGDIVEPIVVEAVRTPAEPSTSKRQPGRPSTAYDEASGRSKRRRIKSTSEQHPTHELVMAAAHSARSDENPELAAVLKETVATPKRPQKLRQGMRDSARLKKSRSLTPDEALAVSVSADMTARGYSVVRKMTNKVSAIEVYPPYHKITDARKQCCPNQVNVSDVSAEVPLQSMLDHTVQRLIQAESEIVLDLIVPVTDPSDPELTVTDPSDPKPTAADPSDPKPTVTDPSDE